MNKTITTALSLLITFSLTAQITWRGENFSGRFQEEGLLKEWPESGPEKILQIDGIGGGWGSAVFANNKIYVIGKTDTFDILYCHDLEGNKLWEQKVGAVWIESFPDSRSTPTVEDDRVYAMSGRGQLSCFNAGNGTRLWYVNVDSLYQAKWHTWGCAESSLIVDDMVISVPGGDLTTMVAFNKLTGETVWESEPLGEMRSYVSSVLFRNDSINQIVGMTTKTLFAVDVATGKMMWTYKLSERIAEIKGGKIGERINANSPLIKGNRIYISQGYDNMSVMLEVIEKGTAVKEVWIDRTLDCHHHGVVEIDGYIFGSNWYNNRDGRWVCLDWETSEVRQVTEWHNKGVTVAADGMLYLYSEKPGFIGLAKPGKKGLRIISSFPVDFGKGRHWAHPFIADGKLFVRRGESIGVFDISE